MVKRKHHSDDEWMMCRHCRTAYQNGERVCNCPSDAEIEAKQSDWISVRRDDLLKLARICDAAQGLSYHLALDASCLPDGGVSVEDMRMRYVRATRNTRRIARLLNVLEESS